MKNSFKNLIDLSPKELRDLPKNQTVFWFAVNGIDDRGDHLPLGFSSKIAEAYCLKSAEQLDQTWAGWTSVLAPPLWATVDPKNLELGVGIRAHVVRDYLVDSCLALSRQGFRYFVVWCGTDSPRQVAAIEDAGRVLLARTGHAGIVGVLKSRSFAPILICANSGTLSQAEVFESPMLPSLKDHGGSSETALALDLGIISEQAIQGLSQRSPQSSIITRLISRWRNRGAGYFGDPARAVLGTGSHAMNERIQSFLLRFKAVTTGTPPQSLFRSWYSVFWPNRSFFKAWMLSLALVALLVVWLVISLQMMMT
jgi:creatinine amidohydrolase/Fe(II)-dependent formamide hydrolase-like protein